MKSPMLAWFMLIQGFSMLTRLFLRSYSCNANIVNLFFAIGKFTQKSFCLFSHDSKNTKKPLYQRYNDFLKVLRASWKPLSTGDRGRTDTPSTGTGFWVQRVCQFRHAGKIITRWNINLIRIITFSGKAVTGFEPVMKVLQTSALPLGYTAIIYFPNPTGLAGFEPAHDGVKVHCLTTWL